MVPVAQPRKVSPMALTGKILAINGGVFVGLGVLLAAYTLLSQSGTPSTGGNALPMVTGLLAAIFGGIGLLEVLAGLVLRLIPGNSPTANIVNQYYAALENQDYTTAFQCLDPYMRTPQGQPITPDWFVQRAQAYDAEQGRVTNYSLSGVKANPGIRRFTIKVTRGSSSYKTNLFLRKQGFDWKITGFDRF